MQSSPVAVDTLRTLLTTQPLAVFESLNGMPGTLASCV